MGSKLDTLLFISYLFITATNKIYVKKTGCSYAEIFSKLFQDILVKKCSVYKTLEMLFCSDGNIKRYIVVGDKFSVGRRVFWSHFIMFISLKKKNKICCKVLHFSKSDIDKKISLNINLNLFKTLDK